jgi:hypothetical protein
MISQTQNKNPDAPVKILKTFNPFSKQYFYDGTRFGVKSNGVIVWLKHVVEGNFTGWVEDSPKNQTDQYESFTF